MYSTEEQGKAGAKDCKELAKGRADASSEKGVKQAQAWGAEGGDPFLLNPLSRNLWL